MQRLLAGLFLLAATTLAACQGGGGLIGNGGSPVIAGSSPSSGSAIGPSSPGSGDGPVGSGANAPPAPDGTLGSQTDTPEINHLDMYIYGQDPRSVDPSAKKGVVRLVFWPSDAAVLNQWQTLTKKQIVDKIKAEGLAWDLVQPAKWKDFEVGFDDSASTWSAGDEGTEDMALKLYFWLPPNTIPMVTPQHFVDLDQFLHLFQSS